MQFIDEAIYKDKIGIYGIKNLLNGKIYVGQTGERFQKRYWNHRWKLRNNQHDNKHLQSAWNKYGEENFSFFVIKIVDNIDLLSKLEIEYIAYYRQRNLSYNILDGGEGLNGYSLPIEIRKQIGQKNRSRMLGTKLSLETRQKMSERRKGRIVHTRSHILNEKIAFKIKTMLVSGYSATEISKDTGIDYKLVSNIISNNTWASVSVDGWDDFIKNRQTYKRLTKEDHATMYKLHIENGLTKYDLAKMYDKNIKTIEQILREQRKLYDNPVPSSK